MLGDVNISTMQWPHTPVYLFLLASLSTLEGGNGRQGHGGGKCKVMAIKVIGFSQRTIVIGLYHYMNI